MVVQRVQCWHCATVRMIRCVVHVLPRSGIDGPLCMVITCWYVSYVMQRRLVCDWTHAVRVYTFVQYRSCPACYVASHAVTASRPSCMRLAPHNKTLILLINDRYGHIIQQLNGVEVAQFISLWYWLCRRDAETNVATTCGAACSSWLQCWCAACGIMLPANGCRG
jgi:hypothetical protein